MTRPRLRWQLMGDKLLKKLSGRGNFSVCYEARSTECGLYRQAANGIPRADDFVTRPVRRLLQYLTKALVPTGVEIWRGP